MLMPQSFQRFTPQQHAAGLPASVLSVRSCSKTMIENLFPGGSALLG